MKVSKSAKKREKKKLDKLASKQQKQEKMKSVLASLAEIEKQKAQVMGVNQDQSTLLGMRSSKHMRRKYKQREKREKVIEDD